MASPLPNRRRWLGCTTSRCGSAGSSAISPNCPRRGCTAHPDPDRVDPVDLAALAAESCGAREAQQRAAGLELTTHLTAVPPVLGDPHRLHQGVGNLPENCIRHCRPGDRVEVTVDDETVDHPDADSSHRAARRVVRLLVADTGPGIAPEDLPHVLTRFWRSAQARTLSVGSGLGLAVAAELVRAHHGTIEVTSPQRRGTTVTVTLPAASQGHAVGRT